MRAAEQDAEALQAHITRTYHNLRYGIGITGLALPVLLWIGGAVIDHKPLRSSMSAYYYTSMGDVFVGSLVAIGLFLYLYKGFSTVENWALNVAGALAVGIAMIPTAREESTVLAAKDHLTLHTTLAVAFFLVIAFVCIVCADDTLSLIRDTKIAERLRTVYRLLGIGMIVSPLLAVVVTLVLHSTSRTFFLEAFAIWLFGAYWLVKSRELQQTGAEQLALDGKLQAAPRTVHKEAPGRLVQIAP